MDAIPESSEQVRARRSTFKQCADELVSLCLSAWSTNHCSKAHGLCVDLRASV